MSLWRPVKYIWGHGFMSYQKRGIKSASIHGKFSVLRMLNSKGTILKKINVIHFSLAKIYFQSRYFFNTLCIHVYKLILCSLFYFLKPLNAVTKSLLYTIHFWRVTLSPFYNIWISIFYIYKDQQQFFCWKIRSIKFNLYVAYTRPVKYNSNV